jgi:hypothetical protein
MLFRVHLAWVVIELTTLVMIGTDYIGDLKSNYHTITTTKKKNGKPYDLEVFVSEQNRLMLHTSEGDWP